MRKFCALLMTSFYLLLTTGAYECLLHCTADLVFSQFNESRQLHPANDDHDQAKQADDDDCKKGDCTCCYHHGNYVVKENFRATIDFQFSVSQIALAPRNQERYSSFISEIIKPSICWPRSTGPPFLFRQPIYISNRTLLI